MTKMLKWLIVMLIPLLGLTLTSCPDKPVDEPTTNEDLIVGQWKSTFSGGYALTTFEKSGKYTTVEIENGGDTYSTTGTWSISDDILICEYWENGSGGLEKVRVVLRILSLTKSKLILLLDEPGGDIEEWTRID